MPTTATPTKTVRDLFNPKTAETITSSFTDVEAAEILKTRRNLSAFAQDLIGIVELEGNNGKQMTMGRRFWLHKMALDTSKPTPKGDALGDCQPIFAMFLKAAAKLRSPKILLTRQNAPQIGLVPASKTSTNAGCLYVKGGISFHDTYHGKITPEGAFIPSNKGCPDSVLPFLRVFATRPLEIAAESGRLSGQCALCRRTLTDPESVSMGVGPICAKKWGIL